MLINDKYITYIIGYIRYIIYIRQLFFLLKNATMTCDKNRQIENYMSQKVDILEDVILRELTQMNKWRNMPLSNNQKLHDHFDS